MRTFRFLPACLAAALFVGSAAVPARASVIADSSTANNTFATAQNVDAFFDLSSSPDIGDSNNNDTSTTEAHVTINSTGSGIVAGNVNYDYYVFYVPSAGAHGIFDVDYGMSDATPVDTSIAIWKADGTFVAVSHDYLNGNPGRGGTISQNDPYIESYTPGNGPVLLTAPGYYIIGVGALTFAPPYNSNGPPPTSGWPNDGSVRGIAAGEAYTLNITIAGHVPPPVVPEPASLAMWGLGAMGAMVFARRRRKFAA